MKLNDLTKGKVKAYGFQAFRDLEQVCGDGDVSVISTLSPAIMIGMGIKAYYAPVLPRNTVYNNVSEVLAADLDVNLINVDYTEAGNVRHIVSRHQGTIEHIKQLYGDIPVLAGNLSPDDIQGKDIIGTLPPHLIQYCNSYTAVTINDFDYAKDSDLSGAELIDRIAISRAIKVEVV